MDELSTTFSSLVPLWGEELPSLTNVDPATILSEGDLLDLEQALAVTEPMLVSPAEFEALNFDLSDDVSEEPQNLQTLDFRNQLSDLAATFDGEPPPLPNVQPVSRPIFSGVESMVFSAMATVTTALPGYQLYDVAADLGAGQIVLNWQLQQLRTAVRSLLSHSRNLGTATEAATENSATSGVLPEGLLRLREISEDIDLALFEIEQANADRQRQIWQVQELAREERLCSLGSLGQQLAQGLARPSVQLIVENSTVALDRTFARKLAEPLGDLLRLLVDRSIEAPAERQRLGKPAVATLQLRGGAVGDTLNLEITDDGAGLPFDIFQPGALGAPIAHRCQALGIALQPDFVSGRGSRIHLQLPYVLLMTRVLLLRIGPAMVAVRTEHVRDIVAVPPSDSRTLIWGHRTIPWLNAQDRFWVNCRRQELPVFEDPVQENVLVVLQSGDHQYALAVDACWREQEATLQRLTGGVTLSFPFCGFAVLTDGRAIPLLSPSEMLFQPNEENTQLRLLEKQKRQSAREILTRRSPQLILLVDDSINVRRYLASLLEGAGFTTVQARDGVEALEKLENGLQPGAIIADLEMPRMDGYTLLQRVRARELTRNVPFVVLTSRTNERHRQQAAELGATAYVNKPYRNEEMIRLMQQLTAPVTDR
ncbi:MAG: response regulator [Pseudanabaenaceae cyanobacterium]